MDPHDLFLADSLCLEASNLFIRAVTAGESGRYGEQLDLISEASRKIAQVSALTGARATEAARPDTKQEAA